MSSIKKFPGKPLLTKWQQVMNENMPTDGTQPDPAIMAMMHAVFMFGALAVASTFSQMEDGNIEEGVKELTDELNTWADTMRLAQMPLATAARN